MAKLPPSHILFWRHRKEGGIVPLICNLYPDNVSVNILYLFSVRSYWHKTLWPAVLLAQVTVTKMHPGHLHWSGMWRPWRDFSDLRWRWGRTDTKHHKSRSWRQNDLENDFITPWPAWPGNFFKVVKKMQPKVCKNDGAARRRFFTMKKKLRGLIQPLCAGEGWKFSTKSD